MHLVFREFDDFLVTHGLQLSVGQNIDFVVWQVVMVAPDLLLQLCIADFDGVQLHGDGLLQLANRTVEELIVVLAELGLHSAEVYLTDRQQLRWPTIVHFDRKNALELLLMPSQIFCEIMGIARAIFILRCHFEILLNAICYDVEHTKVSALLNGNERLI